MTAIAETQVGSLTVTTERYEPDAGITTVVSGGHDVWEFTDEVETELEGLHNHWRLVTKYRTEQGLDK